MTVEAITRKAGPYEYTPEAPYPFTFKVFNNTDILVVLTKDDVESTLSLDTDYTVQLNVDQDDDPGGSVTLLKTYSEDVRITIGSVVPYDQGTVITNRGGFYPDTLNKAYDKLTILCQQLLEQVSRCIKVKISSESSADEFKDELEGLAQQSAESAAAAATASQQAARDSAKAVSDAETALEQSTTALSQSGAALSQSTTALSNSESAVNDIQPALKAAEKASSDAADAVTKSQQALSETAQIDEKVGRAVHDAIDGIEIPGLTADTISGALGYTPYDAETNDKNFATEEEVDAKIAAIPQPDIEALTANKADTNLSNIAAEAKEMMSGAGFESDNMIPVTLPYSGGKLKAPANGYFMGKLSGTEKNNDWSADNYHNSKYIASHCGIHNWVSHYLVFPVTKGDEVTFWNTTGKSVFDTGCYFWFVYANGSVPA